MLFLLFCILILNYFTFFNLTDLLTITVITEKNLDMSRQKAKSMSDLGHAGNSNTNVCVVLQPPLPTLQNRASIEGSTSSTLTGSVPILLTPNLMNASANTLPVTNISSTSNTNISNTSNTNISKISDTNISNTSNTNTSVADSATSNTVENDSQPQERRSAEQKSPVFSI